MGKSRYQYGTFDYSYRLFMNVHVQRGYRRLIDPGNTVVDIEVASTNSAARLVIVMTLMTLDALGTVLVLVKGIEESGLRALAGRTWPDSR